MISLGCFLLASLVGANDITPDWNILTDFKAEYKFNGKNLAGQPVPPFIEGATEKGTIKFDLAAERLEISSKGALHDPHPQGPRMKARGTLTFDGPKGFIALKAKSKVRQGPKKAGLDFCVKVNIPAGLLPPGQMLVDDLNNQKAMIEQQLSAVPTTDVEIHGEDVAIMKIPVPGPEPQGTACEGYEQCPVGWRCERPTDAMGHCEACGSVPDHPTDDCNPGSSPLSEPLIAAEKPANLYIGLRHNAAPFGAGFEAPADGKWNAVLEFPKWKHGAGEIGDVSCVPGSGVSTSAAELLADSEASQTLRLYDEIVTSLHAAQPLNKVFVGMPASPLALFQEAAANELSAKANVALMKQNQMPYFLAAITAGAFGSMLVLFILKLMRKEPLMIEPLLEQTA